MRKNIMIRIAALACMASMLVGCTLVRVNPERDRQLVIAVVNGEEVLKAEYLNIYQQQKFYLQYYGITDENQNDPRYRDLVRDFKENILDAIVTNKIVEQRAEAAGYTVSEEDLIKEKEDTIAEWAEYLKSLDESKGAEIRTQREYEEMAVEELQKAADERYITVDELIRQQAVDRKNQEFRDEVLKDEVASPQEVERYYQENLASQQADTTTIPSADVVLYQTPGVKVHYIRLEMNAEQQAEYDALAADDEEAADAYLEKELRSRAVALKNEAEEIGWDAMEEKYGEDEQMSLVAEPFEMRKGGPYWDDAIIDRLLKVDEGQIADPVIFKGVYYIYWVDEHLSEKVYTLTEKQGEIQELLDRQKKDAKWAEITEQWRNESEIKTYKGRLR